MPESIIRLDSCKACNELPVMTGITAVSPLLPVLSPRFFASVKNSRDASLSRVTLVGSRLRTCREAIAAAVLLGDKPTLNTNPGAVYFRNSTNSLRPAMYPPHDPKDLLRVPIQISTSSGLTPKCSAIPRPCAPIVPIEWASSTINQHLCFLQISMNFGRFGKSPSIL